MAELDKVSYETRYFDTTKTIGPKEFLGRTMRGISKNWVQLSFQQSNPAFTVTVVSICTSTELCDGSIMRWNRFPHNDNVAVFGVIALKVSRHKTVISSQDSDQIIILVVGHDNGSFCIFHRGFNHKESEREIYTTYSKEMARSEAADRDACQVDSNIILSATLRRQIGKD